MSNAGGDANMPDMPEMPYKNHAGLPIVDLPGKRRLPIGTDSFVDALTRCVYVDKSSLVSELIDSAYKVTLFCRPRRFGKSLAMSMLKAFFEAPVEGRVPDRRALFEQLAVWRAGEEYRAEQGRYPVVALTLGDCGGASWEECRAAIAGTVAMEYGRHGYLRDSPALSEADLATFERVASGDMRDGDLKKSLVWLTEALARHHGAPAVVLIDEYDRPVTQGHLRGYRDEAVAFMRDWLTGALKSNEALRLACLTGVQRVSRESIFSGLNNLVVNTPMDGRFTEGFGFTEDEAARLAGYVGQQASIGDMRNWYDGYNFGGKAVYNPWSVLNYLDQGGVAQVYWANTADNGIIHQLFARAQGSQRDELRGLAAGGEVVEPVNLNTVFSDLDRDPAAIWGQLYLAGYVTTDDTGFPNDARRPRRLRVPNREVAQVYRGEIADRAQREAGACPGRIFPLHAALTEGRAGDFACAMREVLVDTPSHLDLTSENAYHMLLAGLLFDVYGYRAPLSNREHADGRPDIVLIPERENLPSKPAVVIECKLASGEDDLDAAARRGLDQADRHGYAERLPGSGALVWGVAFYKKGCAAVCERK